MPTITSFYKSNKFDQNFSETIENNLDANFKKENFIVLNDNFPFNKLLSYFSGGVRKLILVF